MPRATLARIAVVETAAVEAEALLLPLPHVITVVVVGMAAVEAEALLPLLFAIMVAGAAVAVNRAHPRQLTEVEAMAGAVVASRALLPQQIVAEATVVEAAHLLPLAITVAVGSKVPLLPAITAVEAA